MKHRKTCHINVTPRVEFIGNILNTVFLWSFRATGNWTKHRSRHKTNSYRNRLTQYRHNKVFIMTFIGSLCTDLLVVSFGLVSGLEFFVLYRDWNFLSCVGTGIFCLVSGLECRCLGKTTRTTAWKTFTRNRLIRQMNPRMPLKNLS